MATETYRERLGETERGGYFVLTVELRERHEGCAYQTITHGTTTDPVQVSFTGEFFERRNMRRDDFTSAGQNLEDLDLITKPAPGFTLNEIHELGALWRRWHLNDMRAECAHMELPDDPSYDARKDIVCPETGYKYGSAWLAEDVPADVLDHIRHLMRDRSHDLHAARGYDAAGHKYPSEG
ncbi:MAG TPA: hypothetical protein VFH56_02455 [Acidimicrobiales bacterium]|nr:hypothetical protein [Acidimicrobiales bacterium]